MKKNIKREYWIKIFNLTYQTLIESYTHPKNCKQAFREAVEVANMLKREIKKNLK